MVNRASGRSVHTSCDKLRPRGRNRCRGPDIASPAIRRLNWPSPAIDGDALYAAGRVRRPFSAVTVRERVRPCSDRCCWELGDDCVCGHAIVGKQSDELVQQHVEICKVGRLVMLVDHAVVGGRIVSSSASPVIQMRTAPSRVGASNSVTTKGLSWFGSIGCVPGDVQPGPGVGSGGDGSTECLQRECHARSIARLPCPATPRR